jgi:hypothetical protein
MTNQERKAISLVINQELEDYISDVLLRLKAKEGLAKNSPWMDKTILKKSSLLRVAILEGLKSIEKEHLK